MVNTRLALLGLLALASAGCMPQATFDVTIVNRTNDAVTVGIVKEGEPYEPTLAGPERWAIHADLESLPKWGHAIPSGRTMDSGPVTGAFPRGSLAYLRVYRGERDNATLIAISAPSPDRADVLLFPGRSAVIITEDDKGAIHAVRLPPRPAPNPK